MPDLHRRRTSSPTTRLMARTAVLVIVLTGLVPSLASTGEARASDPEPGDYARALEGWLESIPKDRAEMFRCPELAGGTAGTPEREFFPPRDPIAGHGRNGQDAPSVLPDRVELRGTERTSNRRWEFALAEGAIWFRANEEVTGIDEPWARLEVPDCFVGGVIGIAADDDELIAIDEDRWIYTLDNILSAPESFTWTMRWGPPFWTGAGHQLPEGVRGWDWSVISRLEDGTFRDDAGNDHEIGEGKVSHIWVIDPDHRLVYIDPWLPRDTSYEMCAPHRGRFQARSIGASGSTVLIVGPSGDLFTRLYDFDIAGPDTVFFSYAYEDQRDEPNPDIQLPSPDWIEHAKIPGTITDRISIHKVGEGAIHRTLRVEGEHQGRTGYWEKDITEPTWAFVPTGRALQGEVLPNPSGDTSDHDLGPSRDRRYAGEVEGATVAVDDFHVVCTPSRLTVHVAGGDEPVPLVLHVVDGVRQDERAAGLDDEPRWMQGTIEIPPEVREAAGPEARAWLDTLGEDRFLEADLDVTAGEMRFRDQGWTLRYEPAGRADPGTDSTGAGPQPDHPGAPALPATGGGAAVWLGATALAGGWALRRRQPVD